MLSVFWSSFFLFLITCLVMSSYWLLDRWYSLWKISVRSGLQACNLQVAVRWFFFWTLVGFSWSDFWIGWLILPTLWEIWVFSIQMFRVWSTTGKIVWFHLSHLQSGIWIINKRKSAILNAFLDSFHCVKFSSKEFNLGIQNQGLGRFWCFLSFSSF